MGCEYLLDASTQPPSRAVPSAPSVHLHQVAKREAPPEAPQRRAVRMCRLRCRLRCRLHCRCCGRCGRRRHRRWRRRRRWRCRRRVQRHVGHVHHGGSVGSGEIVRRRRLRSVGRRLQRWRLRWNGRLGWWCRLVRRFDFEDEQLGGLAQPGERVRLVEERGQRRLCRGGGGGESGGRQCSDEVRRFRWRAVEASLSVVDCPQRGSAAGRASEPRSWRWSRVGAAV
jgi:hypothetical protein